MTEVTPKSELGPIPSLLIGASLGLLACVAGWIGGLVFVRSSSSGAGLGDFAMAALFVLVEAGLGVSAGLVVGRLRAHPWYLGWTALGIALLGAIVISVNLSVFARSGPIVFIASAWLGTTLSGGHDAQG